MDRNMRRVIGFTCAGETLFGTLDAAPGTTGLLIVSGGNEIRIGAHRGMALLAERLAAHGVPVFRFDRRGIGDSTGANHGFTASAPDIAAAAATFRTESGAERIVAFGNCDAATALAIFGGAAGIASLILANPWTIEEDGDLPPAAGIRAHYADKLRSPGEWLRLLSGGVNFGKLIRGIGKLLHKPSEQPGSLSEQLRAALSGWAGRAVILLAERDMTARAFSAAIAAAPGIPVHRRDTASHSFAEPGDADWLFDQIIAALGRA